MHRSSAKEHVADISNEVSRYTSRLIYAPSCEDITRELITLGVPPEQSVLLSTHFQYRMLKLERVESTVAGRLRDIVLRLDGKAVVSVRSPQDQGVVDVLIVANTSCLTGLVSELKKHPAPFDAVAKEVEWAVKAVVDQWGSDFHIECKGKTLDLSKKTYIMGILNITPDSFSDGGTFFNHQTAIEEAARMVDEGADIIDVGGESTRPGSESVAADEELRRIIPVIEAIENNLDVLVSVDTMKGNVAEEALAAGAHIINDVSALRFDPALADVAAQTGAPVVLMHMRGMPRTMQQNTHYDDTLSEIIEHLHERIGFAEQSGIARNQIIIDPGIGFGKSLDRDNLTILRNLQEFASLGRPILVGPSRKTFLGKVLNVPVEDRVEATGAAVAVAAMNGASIVRVHDVKAMKRIVTVVDAIKNAAPTGKQG